MRVRVLRIFVPMLLIVSAAFCAAQSPTMEETVQWLRTHTFPKLKVGLWAPSINLPWKYSTSDETGEVTYISWANFKFSKMTAITVTTGQTRNSTTGVTRTYPIISITGPGRIAPCDEEDCSLTVGSLEFSASTPPQDIERYAKALRHLAELNGATLAKDNIF